MSNFISSLLLLRMAASSYFLCFLLFLYSRVEFCEVAIKEMNTSVIKVSGEVGLMVVFPQSPFVSCWKC